MSTTYVSATPPRLAGTRMRLTPSAAPFLTPSKIGFSNDPIEKVNSSFTSNSSTRNSNNSFSSYGNKRFRTPHRSSKNPSNRPTPFYTPHQTPSGLDSNDDDRFIPSRGRMNMEICRRALLAGEKRCRTSSSDDAAITTTTVSQETPLQKEFKRRMLSTLCNIPLEKLDDDARPIGILSFGQGGQPKTQVVTKFYDQHRFGENVAPSGIKGMPTINPFSLDTIRMMKLGDNAEMDPSTSGLSAVANKALRKVPNAPFRILDAPDIVDDYYLNLISWSKDNILAVALARSVYLWNSTSGEIHHLITVQGVDYVTSVCWCTQPGQTKYIAIGTHLNIVHLYDGLALTKVRSMEGAAGRIASLSWNNNHNFLSAGDRDACIINHDMRSEQHIVSKYRGHLQEVCGLKWNDEGSCLASGGNENYLCLWDVALSNRSSNRSNRNANSDSSSMEHGPRLILKQHKAAVKALDWCPFHRGLLASGGGTADRSIKFWNTSSGVMLNTIDTGSQVCSLIWSKHQREICSSHGYSENQLILWKYLSMTKIKELTGHTARVLNMDISPDGASVVSAGADETLRFWNLFDTPSNRSTGGMHFGELSFGGHTIR